VILWSMPVPAGISAQDMLPNTFASLENQPCWQPTRPRTAEGTQVSEFFELGLGEMLAVSASHGQGMRMLVDLALAPLTLIRRNPLNRKTLRSSSWQCRGPMSANQP
jgi:GTP-binding protein